MNSSNVTLFDAAPKAVPGGARPGHATLRQPGEIDVAELPPEPWSLAGVDAHAKVLTLEDVERVLLARHRGATLRVTIDAAATNDVRVGLLDGLHRSGGFSTSRGNPVLDERQRRLVQLMAEGYSIAEAATAMHFARRTLERDLQRLRSALGASNNRQAVLLSSAEPSTQAGTRAIRKLS